MINGNKRRQNRRLRKSVRVEVDLVSKEPLRLPPEPDGIKSEEKKQREERTAMMIGRDVRLEEHLDRRGIRNLQMTRLLVRRTILIVCFIAYSSRKHCHDQRQGICHG